MMFKSSEPFYVANVTVILALIVSVPIMTALVHQPFAAIVGSLLRVDVALSSIIVVSFFLRRRARFILTAIAQGFLAIYTFCYVYLQIYEVGISIIPHIFANDAISAVLFIFSVALVAWCLFISAISMRSYLNQTGIKRVAKGSV